MTTRTTFHLFISRRDLAVARLRAYLAQRDPLALVSLIVVASIMVVAGVRAWPAAAPAVALEPTPPLPIIMVATQPPAAAAPTTVPALQVESARLTIPRALVVYTAPDGSAIGAVEAGRAYDYVARSGADWIQVDIAGSGIVWVRASDLTGVPPLTDLAPTLTPIVLVERQPAIVQLAAPTPDKASPVEPTDASALQTIAVQADDESLSPALLREAMDQ